jgi:hypothetical protein
MALVVAVGSQKAVARAARASNRWICIVEAFLLGDDVVGQIANLPYYWPAGNLPDAVVDFFFAGCLPGPPAATTPNRNSLLAIVHGVGSFGKYTEKSRAFLRPQAQTI